MKKIMLSLVLCGLFISIPHTAKPNTANPTPTAVAIGGGIAAGVVAGLAAYDYHFGLAAADACYKKRMWQRLDSGQRAIAIASIPLVGVIGGLCIGYLLWLDAQYGRNWRPAKKKMYIDTVHSRPEYLWQANEHQKHLDRRERTAVERRTAWAQERIARVQERTAQTKERTARTQERIARTQERTARAQERHWTQGW